MIDLRQFIIYFALFISVVEYAYSESDNTGMEQFKKVSSIVNPFELRDPFKRNLPKRSRLKKIGNNKLFNGSEFTNIESVSGIPIEQIRVLGVLLGTNRRAIVKVVNAEGSDVVRKKIVGNTNPDSDGQITYVVKEGMRLGVDGAEVKAILPGGIVLVEKIRNVYDQDEYLETIIPVSE